jgi:16S rRNA (guanine527-N7)-methyltransferase
VDPKVEIYLDLLFKWNQTYRLTAFDTRKQALAVGVNPSLAILDDLPKGARVLDVGSGGGFPAIPLAIVRPDLTFVLTEPSRQKAAFLREATVRLGLGCRVEAAPVEVLLRSEVGPWDAVTVRGVNVRHGLLKRLVGVLVPGGLLAIWSGGERERNYAQWAAAAGVILEERLLAAHPPIPLLLARVPRGTVNSSTMQ